MNTNCLSWKRHLTFKYTKHAPPDMCLQHFYCNSTASIQTSLRAEAGWLWASGLHPQCKVWATCAHHTLLYCDHPPTCSVQTTQQNTPKVLSRFLVLFQCILLGVGRHWLVQCSIVSLISRKDVQVPWLCVQHVDAERQSLAISAHHF